MKNKRLFSFLLALCMLVSLIPAGAVTAYASENEPAVISVDVPYQVNPVYADIIDVDENEYYASSSPIKTYGIVTYVSESEAVKQLRQAMVNRETSVQINYTTSNANINQSLHEVFDAAIAHTGNPVEGDYLKFTYGGHESHARAYPGDMAKVEATYTISYYTTASQEAALDVEVTKLLDQLDLYDSSDYQKLRGVYEYITKNIRYDYDNLNDNSYHLKHTAYAALMNKTAVCQGYANLFYRLALALDVDARIIAGDGVVGNTAGPHAWNIAKLGNKYYNLDATWDEGQTKYNWFLLSPASFADHYRYEDYSTTAFNSAYPMSTTNYQVPALAITAQPTDKTVTAGEKAKFSVAATGENLTYQWQYKSPSGTSWASTTFSGNKTATLTVTTQEKHDGYQYRCKVTDGTTTVYSNAATLTVKAALAITTQPTDKTVTAGEKAKFSVVAAGENLTYQWQYKSPSGTSWASTTFSGNKTATLTVTTQAKHNGYQYRCVVTDGSANTVTSEPATLTVKAATTGLSITTQPADKTATAGSKVKFSVVASGSNLTYQWQYRKPGGSWTNSGVSSGKTANLTVTAYAKYSGYEYRCKITSGTTTIYSEPATLTVGTGLSITTQPADKTATTGSKVTFKVVASGNNLTYQWQYRKPGGSWTNSGVSSGKTANLTVTAYAKYSGYEYRCKITSGTTTIYSEPATLTVGTGLSITTQPTNKTATAGSKVTFKVVASGSNLTYQWQYKSPTGSWTNSGVSSGKTANLTVTAYAKYDGYQYRCKITSGTTTVTSNAVTLTVQ